MKNGKGNYQRKIKFNKFWRTQNLLNLRTPKHAPTNTHAYEYYTYSYNFNYWTFSDNLIILILQKFYPKFKI